VGCYFILSYSLPSFRVWVNQEDPLAISASHVVGGSFVEERLHGLVAMYSFGAIAFLKKSDVLVASAVGPSVDAAQENVCLLAEAWEPPTFTHVTPSVADGWLVGSFDGPFLLRGAPFTLRTLHAVANIPRGTVKCYGELAALAGSPTAARAVGRIVASNHLAPLIPCHRVVPRVGGVGNYRWGVGLKQALLQKEGVSLQPLRTTGLKWLDSGVKGDDAST